ncbi:MAG TPA: hypothetical protein VFM18_12395, partial [Methanosarcina sp.]|nr:hypothetical protein [Methanosarcina sp.]
MQTFPPVTTDIFIVQNSSYNVTYDVPNVNQYLFFACIRKTQDDDAFVEFTVSTDTVANTATFSMDPATTGLMKPKTYLYQVLAKNQIDQSVSVIAQGNAIVDPGVAFSQAGSSPTEI